MLLTHQYISHAILLMLLLIIHFFLKSVTHKMKIIKLALTGQTFKDFARKNFFCSTFINDPSVRFSMILNVLR